MRIMRESHHAEEACDDNKNYPFRPPLASLPFSSRRVSSNHNREPGALLLPFPSFFPSTRPGKIKPTYQSADSNSSHNSMHRSTPSASHTDPSPRSRIPRPGDSFLKSSGAAAAAAAVRLPRLPILGRGWNRWKSRQVDPESEFPPQMDGR